MLEHTSNRIWLYRIFIRKVVNFIKFHEVYSKADLYTWAIHVYVNWCKVETPSIIDAYLWGNLFQEGSILFLYLLLSI